MGLMNIAMRNHPARDELRKARFGIGILVLTLMALVQSCSEIKYRVWGEETDAVVRKVAESYSGPDEVLVSYSFQTETNEWHRGRFTTPARQWRGAIGDGIRIAYLPSNPDHSRRATDASLKWPAILAGLTIAGTAWLAYALILARRGVLI